MKGMEKTLRSAEELVREAESFAANLAPCAGQATLVTLSGELGAGKTAFTQALARALGVTDPVTSPTFVLEKSYALPERTDGFARLVHIDAYRLSGGESLAPLGLAELMRDPSNLVVLEWPELVEDGLPEAAHHLSLTVLPDNGRTLSYA